MVHVFARKYLTAAALGIILVADWNGKVTGQIGPTVGLQWNSETNQFFVVNPHLGGSASTELIGTNNLIEQLRQSLRDYDSTEPAHTDEKGRKLTSPSDSSFKAGRPKRTWSFLNKESRVSCPRGQRGIFETCRERSEGGVSRSFCETSIRCKPVGAGQSTGDKSSRFFAHSDHTFSLGSQHYFEVTVEDLSNSPSEHVRVGVAVANASPGDDQYREWSVGSDGSWSVTGSILNSQDPQGDILWGSVGYDGWIGFKAGEKVGVFVNLLKKTEASVTFFLLNDGDEAQRSYQLTITIDGFQRILSHRSLFEVEGTSTSSASQYSQTGSVAGRFGYDQFAHQASDSSGISLPKKLSVGGVILEFEQGRFGSELPSIDAIERPLVETVPLDGCSKMQNPAQLNGNIAYILRGGCDFVDKAYYAQQAGAVAVVVANYHEKGRAVDELIIMDHGNNQLTNEVTIPCVFVSRLSAERIQRQRARVTKNGSSAKLVATLRGALYSPGHHGLPWQAVGVRPAVWLSQGRQVNVRHYGQVPQWVLKASEEKSDAQYRGCRPVTYLPLANSEIISETVIAHRLKLSSGVHFMTPQQVAEMNNLIPHASSALGNQVEDIQLKIWKEGSKRLTRSVFVCGEDKVPLLTMPSHYVQLGSVNVAPWLQYKPGTSGGFSPIIGTPMWSLIPTHRRSEVEAHQKARKPLKLLTEADSNWSHCAQATQMNALPSNGVPGRSGIVASISWAPVVATPQGVNCVFARVSTSGAKQPPHHLGQVSAEFENDVFASGLRAKALHLFEVGISCTVLLGGNGRSGQVNHPTTVRFGVMSQAYSEFQDRYREFSISNRGTYHSVQGASETSAMISESLAGYSGGACPSVVARAMVMIDLLEGSVVFVMRHPSTVDQTRDSLLTEPFDADHPDVVVITMSLLDRRVPNYFSIADSFPRVAWGWAKSGKYPPFPTKQLLPLSPVVPFVKINSPGNAGVRYAVRLGEYTSSQAQVVANSVLRRMQRVDLPACTRFNGYMTRCLPAGADNSVDPSTKPKQAQEKPLKSATAETPKRKVVSERLHQAKVPVADTPVVQHMESGLHSNVNEEAKLGLVSTEAVPESVAKEVEPESVTKEVKPESATKEVKPASVAKEVKPESVAKEVKPESVAKEVKPESATKEVKPESVAKEVKPESATKEVKPEAVTKERKPESVAKEVKPEAVTKERKPEAVTKEVKP